MIRTITLICCIIATPIFAEAKMKTTNEMIKDCLTAYQYDYGAPVDKRLNNFDWQSASNCVAGFSQDKHEKKLAEQRKFLNDNPWYKGKNWKWTERAEYTCVKQYHTGLTVCHKPIYIN